MSPMITNVSNGGTQQFPVATAAAHNSRWITIGDATFLREQIIGLQHERYPGRGLYGRGEPVDVYLRSYASPVRAWISGESPSTIAAYVNLLLQSL